MMPVSYLVHHYTPIIQVYWYSTKLHCVVELAVWYLTPAFECHNLHFNLNCVNTPAFLCSAPALASLTAACADLVQISCANHGWVLFISSSSISRLHLYSTSMLYKLPTCFQVTNRSYVKTVTPSPIVKGLGQALTTNNKYEHLLLSYCAIIYIG